LLRKTNASFVKNISKQVGSCFIAQYLTKKSAVFRFIIILIIEPVIQLT